MLAGVVGLGSTLGDDDGMLSGVRDPDGLASGVVVAEEVACCSDVASTVCPAVGLVQAVQGRRAERP